jgi:hypothetical protein
MLYVGSLVKNLSAPCRLRTATAFYWADEGRDQNAPIDDSRRGKKVFAELKKSVAAWMRPSGAVIP